ncbi:hypothetical protein [Gorillibacterium sp. CAU 1737]|uniref:hypothetical protein n=1 Tax=Gorillibacterium sp. CAU 1737 TaxID=3140362 RepID=UPI003260DA00
MMKRTLHLVMAFLLIATGVGSTAHASDSVQARVTTSSTSFDGEWKESAGFNIKGNNYYRLRDLARNLSETTSQFDVTWNGKENAIEIVTGKAYFSDESEEIPSYYPSESYRAVRSTSKVIINGTKQEILAYTIEGSTYFQLRDLATRIPFEVEYDSKEDRIAVYSQVPEHAYRAKTAFTASESNVVESELPRWQSQVKSNLIQNQDGTISVIEASDKLTIETYDAGYKLVGQKSLPFELPLFGAFYSGEKYNYVAFGQKNKEENDEKEVIRIVRYDKSFNRIDSVSIKGGPSYTVIPFDAGSGRMAESGNKLVFHTSRERYTSEDGLNHQSQLTIIVDTSTMKVVNDLGKFQKNHVSHSFDQYVQFDGSSHVLVDHGDAYPRSIVLHKGSGSQYTEADLFKIPGAIGANATGVSLGGFELSASHYIVAMNSVDHSKVKSYTSYELVGLDLDQRDILLALLPRNSMTGAKTVTLARYVGSDKTTSIPKLVKLTDDKLMVLWQEFDREGRIGSLKYVYVNGEGTALGAIQTAPYFALSDCNPVLSGDKVVWYADMKGNRTFYTIPVE